MTDQSNTALVVFVIPSLISAGSHIRVLDEFTNDGDPACGCGKIELIN